MVKNEILKMLILKTMHKQTNIKERERKLYQLKDKIEERWLMLQISWTAWTEKAAHCQPGFQRASAAGS